MVTMPVSSSAIWASTQSLRIRREVRIACWRRDSGAVTITTRRPHASEAVGLGVGFVSMTNNLVSKLAETGHVE